MGTNSTKYLGHSNWKQVFKNRNAFNLTQEYLIKWKTQNKSYYQYVNQYIQKKKKGKSKILELGCGPARHAIIIANMGYEVTCVDIDKEILEQAKKNALKLCKGTIRFINTDINSLLTHFGQNSFDGITHGGLMEHFPSESAIQESLNQQLELAPLIVFDVPIDTQKNKTLFKNDDIFRQIWTSKYWLEKVLSPFNICAFSEEIHNQQGMTDDLICALSKKS